MIGKGKAVAHTGVSIAYGWDQGKNAEVVLREHLAGDTAQEVTEEFRMIQEQNTRCHKNTLSFILSPTVEDGQKLDRERLGRIAELFLKDMQLKEHQAIAFVHRDKAHTHVHLYVNRIGFDGQGVQRQFYRKTEPTGSGTGGKGNGYYYGQGSTTGKAITDQSHSKGNTEDT